MLSRYNAVDIEAALRAAEPQPPFPPASDRAGWAAIRQAIGAEKAAGIIAAAELAAQTPIPSLPATVWLEFQRGRPARGLPGAAPGPPHDDDEPGAGRVPRRARPLPRSAAQRGLGDPGGVVLVAARAPDRAHRHDAPPHRPGRGRHRDRSGRARPAARLALDPLVGKRIRYEIDQRCFAPYLLRHDWWWLYNTHLRRVNNWTAVCNAGVVGAALYLETDLSRLAEMIARAARSMDDFLSTFDADGGSERRAPAIGPMASATTASLRSRWSGAPAAESASWMSRSSARPRSSRCAPCSAPACRSTSRIATAT